MKKTLILSAIAIAMLFTSCNKSSSKTEAATADLSIVEDILTFQAFTDEEVSADDLNKIIMAGVNSQSAINMQPWHFSVVTNKDILTDISEKMKANMPKKKPGDGKDMPPPPKNAGPKAGAGDSPVAIVISGKDGSEFDVGLATQLMAVEAALLGYGTKIISSPNIILNGEAKEEYKQILDIPADMSSKAMLLIGHYKKNKLDAVTTASPRKETEEIVSYIK